MDDNLFVEHDVILLWDVRDNLLTFGVDNRFVEDVVKRFGDDPAYDNRLVYFLGLFCFWFWFWWCGTRGNGR